MPEDARYRAFSIAVEWDGKEKPRLGAEALGTDGVWPKAVGFGEGSVVLPAELPARCTGKSQKTGSEKQQSSGFWSRSERIPHQVVSCND